VYDVGPNIGQSTLLVLTSRTTEQVVLIEPNPVALGIAAENIFRNGFSQRTRFICAFAAASSGGKVKFYTVGFGSAGSAIRDFASTASASNTSLEVPNISLDDILAETGLLPDLVKIDVEGSEAGVLAGSVEIARKLRTTFIVEMHAGASLPMSDNAQMVMSWCDSVSYRAWYLKEHRPLASPDDIAGRGRCHLLLLPGDSTYPEYLRGIPQSGPLV
jgi:FkbM family methyltransferase